MRAASRQGRDDGGGADAEAQFVIRGAGHACYLDAPAIFHKKLLHWLDEQSPA